AFSRAVREGLDDNVQLILAGDAQGRDDYVSALQSAIAENGVARLVKLVGHCSDMPAAMALAEFVLIASTEPEAFGRTSVESQAVGTPVIATAIGGPMETVIPWNGKRGIGWLVPPGDADALANAIAESLAAGSQDRLTLTRNSIANARHNFTTERLKTATLSVYRSRLAPSIARATITAEELTGSLSSPSQRMTDSTANAA
ncbi:MAG: glycosyltransferase, partial [Pseudomonadota bacterium]